MPDNSPTNAMTEDLAAIEARLGVPVGFTQSLEQERDDWAYAVKSCVLLEAALEKVICAHLHNDAVEAHVRYLNMGNRTGKVALAQSLEILTREEGAALLELVNVRNAFAHRVENIRADLQRYADEMPQDAAWRFLWAVLMIPTDMREQIKKHLGGSISLNLRSLMTVATRRLLGALAAQDKAAMREKRRRQQLEDFVKRSDRPLTLCDLTSVEHTDSHARPEPGLARMNFPPTEGTEVPSP